MNAVVTGCAGFVGSHLAECLLRYGGSVVGVDNLITGSDANVRRLLDFPNFAFITEDIAVPSNVVALVGEHIDAVDTVFHLASPAGPADYRRFPLETLVTNGRGTEHAIYLASRFGARLVLASTSGASSDALGAHSCYEQGKRYAEALVFWAHRIGLVDAAIVRIFNTYGPYMRLDDGRVVPTFIGQALGGKALTIHGRGEQTRSFMYVDDLVDALVRIATVPLGGELAVLSVGNPVETSIRTLASLVASLSGVPLQTVESPLPADEAVHRRPDISRARTLLDWEPRVGIVDGLRATIEHFRHASAGGAVAERLRAG